jgi:hypothetical protein
MDLVRNKVQIEDSGETLRRENLALNERILSLENDKSNLAIEKDKFKKMLELAEREMTDMRLRHSEEKRALKIEVERHCEKIFERRSDLLRDTAAKR